MSARVFKLFNQSETIYIADQVRSVMRNWSNKWFNAPDLAEVEIFRADEINKHLEELPDNWLIGEFEQHIFALHCPDSFLDSIYTNIVSVTNAQDVNLNSKTFISRKLVNVNIGSLIDDICKSFYPQKSSIRNSYMTTEKFLNEAARPGSGYIYIKLSLQDSEFMVIAIELSSAQKLASTRSIDEGGRVLHPAINAFGNHTVKLEAFIGSSVIDIKSLTNMAVGDVLTIDSGGNSDIELHIDNKKVCTGKIGKRGNKFAIKISAYHAN